eukprot:Gb_05114 [translate_table: standard]
MVGQMSITVLFETSLCLQHQGHTFLGLLAQGRRKTHFSLRDALSDANEEVGVSNVVQVITEVAPICKVVGLLTQKYRHIFWTPCCVHVLNNALKDIGKFDWIATLI